MTYLTDVYNRRVKYEDYSKLIFELEWSEFKYIQKIIRKNKKILEIERNFIGDYYITTVGMTKEQMADFLQIRKKRLEFYKINEKSLIIVNLIDKEDKVMRWNA